MPSSVLAELPEFGLAARAEPVDVATWLPEMPLVFLEWDDPATGLTDFWQNHLAPALERSDLYAEFRQQPEFAQLLAGMGLVQFVSGKSPLELAQQIGGERIVAAVFPAPQGRDEPAVLLASVHRDEEAAADTMEALDGLLRMGEGREIERPVHRGIRALHVKDGAVVAVVGRVLLVSNEGQTLRSVVDRALDGSEDNVVAKFVARERERSREGAVLRGFAQARALRAMSDEPLPDPFLFPDVLGHLIFGEAAEGLLGAELWRVDAVADGGLDFLVTAAGAEPSASKMTPFPAQSPAARTLAPLDLDDVGMVLSARRDLGAWWHGRAETMQPSTEKGFAKFETDLGVFFERAIGDEIVPQLEGDWQLVVARQRYDEQRTPEHVRIPAFALVAPAADAEVFEREITLALTSLLGILNLERGQQRFAPWRIVDEEHDGLRFVGGRFDVESRAQADPLRHNVSPCVSRVGEFLVFATSWELLERLTAAIASPTGPPALDDGARTAVQLRFAPVRLALQENESFLVAQSMTEDGKTEAQAQLEWRAVGEIAGLFEDLNLESRWHEEGCTLHARLTLAVGAEP